MNQFVETGVAIFSDSYQPPWTGRSRLVMVTEHALDSRLLIAYGADEFTSFRVQLSRVELERFLALVRGQGAEILDPPPSDPTLENVITNPPTIPGANQVQMALDLRLSQAVAA